MALLVKICGLNSEEALDAALDAGADLVGFVFFPPSPRHLDVARARTLAARVGDRAGKVALTVDADDAQFDAIIAAIAPDMLQLHGHETPERVRAVKAAYGRPVMKALPIEQRSDLDAVQLYADVADRLLFDARAPRDATRPGGLGKPFDWTLLAGHETKLPFMLSGGLDAANLAEALAVTRARGVDVSSGVESAPGVKDLEKIRAFILAARGAAPAPITMNAL